MKLSSTLPAPRLHQPKNRSATRLDQLDPAALTRQLDEFQAGHYGRIARTWEAIERRDDVVQSVAGKRKAAAAQHGWEIITLDDSPEALAHRDALTYFYHHLTAVNGVEEDERGGFQLLARQMMDSAGKRFAVHEIVWQPTTVNGQRRLKAEFRFVPLWFFENRSGQLRFLAKDGQREGVPLSPGEWMVTVGPGVMEACSVAYLFKHKPLQDWLLYCERNGTPGVRGVTDARPGSPEWNAARDAVLHFGAEFQALMSRGTEIEAIDLGVKGTLPYPELVERMDRAIVVLWRGADLSTLSRDGGVGVSLQIEEPDLIAEADAQTLSEVLNTQVNRFLIDHLFQAEPRAYLQVRAGKQRNLARDLQVYRTAWEMGLPISEAEFRAHFGLPSLPTGATRLPPPPSHRTALLKAAENGPA